MIETTGAKKEDKSNDEDQSRQTQYKNKTDMKVWLSHECDILPYNYLM